jgi:hypothetical protein
MKKLILLGALALLFAGQGRAQVTTPGVTWDDAYSFDRFTLMKIDFFARGNELMRTLNYKIYYNSGIKDLITTPGGLKVPKGNYMITMDAPSKGTDTETILDMTREVAIQVLGSDLPEPMFNATKFKYPEGEEIKKLELLPSDETRVIAGYTCKKYTYTYKNIFGSVWITTDISLPNDYGIFRAAKMAALHNTLTVGGFVMEMTSEDARGGKTVMTTVSVENTEKKTVTMPKAKMGTSINKVNYFTF